MATSDERTLLHRILEMGEQRLNQAAEELLSNPRFAEAMGRAVQTAMETKGRVDQNMQNVLGFLNVPSSRDYQKLAAKVEALQGSLVNLNMKLDRLIEQQKEQAAKPKTRRPRRRKPAGSKPNESSRDAPSGEEGV